MRQVEKIIIKDNINYREAVELILQFDGTYFLIGGPASLTIRDIEELIISLENIVADRQDKKSTITTIFKNDPNEN